jgi:hypothetical protein
MGGKEGEEEERIGGRGRDDEWEEGSDEYRSGVSMTNGIRERGEGKETGIRQGQRW